MVAFRKLVRRNFAGRVPFAQGGALAVRRGVAGAAGLGLLALASAQSTTIDGAIQEFQAEGTRLIALVSGAGTAIIALSVLMVLGWAMLRKVQGGK